MKKSPILWKELTSLNLGYYIYIHIIIYLTLWIAHHCVIDFKLQQMCMYRTINEKKRLSRNYEADTIL